MYIEIHEPVEEGTYLSIKLAYEGVANLTPDKTNKLKDAINEANLKYRIVKGCYRYDEVVFSVNTWIQSSSDFGRLFKIYMLSPDMTSSEVQNSIK